jgi:hypothetical protein
VKKIRLDADSLEVLTFATEQVQQGRGTVRGASGHHCYDTVAYDRQTICLAYPESYWGEDTCIAVEDTDPSVCPAVDTADPSCMTCLGQPGC